MILHQVETEQSIDRERRGRFLKELSVVRGRSGPLEIPLAMVRKRSATLGASRASVLLIHGYGQNRYTWHLPVRSFSSYLAAQGFDVWNLDLRGHGRSRHLGAPRPADVNEFARQDIPWAIEEIQKVSGPRPVFLVGHSLGGLVSYAAATFLKGAIAGITSIGSPYHFTRGSWPLTLAGHLLLAIDRRVSLGDGALALKYWAEGARLSRVFVESPVFPLPIRGFLPGSMERDVLSQHMSLAMDHGSITVLRNMFLAAVEAKRSGHKLGGLSGFAEAFEAMDVPLLVIAGQHDDVAPPISVEPAYQSSRARDKTYQVFPQGHLDLIMGRAATCTVWPTIADWIGTRS